MSSGRHINEILIEIGLRLKALRKEKGYSSHESFAYDFGISRSHYWRLENGRSNITVSTLISILEVHGLTLCDFFCIDPATINQTFSAKTNY